MRILVTGFQPFGGEAINPSWEAVKLLPITINGCELIKEEIPVSYSGSEKAIIELIKRHSPDIVIATGQAGGREGLSIECLAINRDHSDYPDNDGDIRLYSEITSGSPMAIHTSMDVKGIVDYARGKGINCKPSYSAGTYVCNHIYYIVLSAVKSLFIHVPYIPEQTTDKPNMSLSDISKGIEYAIEFITK